MPVSSATRLTFSAGTPSRCQLKTVRRDTLMRSAAASTPPAARMYSENAELHMSEECRLSACPSTGTMHGEINRPRADFLPMAKRLRSGEQVSFVAQQFERAMEALGLTQAEVARTLGVSPSLLGNWKRGDNYPDAFLMTVFCQRYRVMMDYLYRGVISPALAEALADGWAKAKVASQEPPPEDVDQAPKTTARRRKSVAA